jgi:hypothetical protein
MLRLYLMLTWSVKPSSGVLRSAGGMYVGFAIWLLTTLGPQMSKFAPSPNCQGVDIIEVRVVEGRGGVVSSIFR